MLSLDSYVSLSLEVYLTPHSLNSPCASHAMLAIMEHPCLCALTLVDLITVIFYGPLGCLLLSITLPCRERRSIARLVNFLLTSEFMQSKLYSLGEAYLKVGSLG
jgi:hypothetical protein